jgi:hypothetical protein
MLKSKTWQVVIVEQELSNVSDRTFCFDFLFKLFEINKLYVLLSVQKQFVATSYPD